MEFTLPESIEKVALHPTNVLNIRVSDTYLYNKATDKNFLLNAQTDEKVYKKVLIDYASPNMAKELHVGHLRSTMIGACLNSVFQHKGSEVIGVSHVGDFGSPLGSVIAEVLESGEEQFPWLKLVNEGQEVPDEMLPSPTELTQIYINSKKRSAEDEVFRQKAMSCTRDIQRPSWEDNYSKKIWKLVLQASRNGFDDLYKKLGVTITEKGESSYADSIESAMQDLKEKGLLVQSEGAWVCFTSICEVPLMVQTSDGTYLYAATDFAAIKQRIDSGIDLILYITDQGQRNHFMQVFEIATKAGWFEGKSSKPEHIGFGVVTDTTGKKLSSRDGTPMTLANLLTDSVFATEKAIVATKSLMRSEKKYQQVHRKAVDGQYTTEEKLEWLDEPERLGAVKEDFERHSLANAAHIAYNAIIYFELSNARRTNYKFSFDAMLNMKGNTAMYLIYAYARIRSVLARAGENSIAIPTLDVVTDNSKIIELTSQERALCLQLLSFPDIIDKVLANYEPNHLCGYLFDLAKLFHHFYEMCRVIGSPNQEERLKICLATEVVLFKGLELLNVTALEKV
eukprot:TRINITY_DN6055_c0_g2_i1.p1 TRINITY_DN6055_c0_g2~~TRINITY_DN6055_c0_g2_i1.p1  ORF type:complete len:665 (+),score=167.19 TRINITY_DN6055_c0_g2_i1:297-1997(+)